MLLADVIGSEGTAVPEQIVRVLPKLNVGVMFGFTVTVNVVGTAQSPAVGVNVYTSETWLSTVEGLHVPVMLFVDAEGSVGTVAPLQIVRTVPKLNAGVLFGFTVTEKVVVVAHKPAVGVNVYTAEA
jgi:hypothetical protein